MSLLLTIEPLEVAQAGRTVCQVGPWSLRSGERWWVRGPNGAGKSSFLKVLAGQQWPAPGQHGQRLYHFDEAATWSPMAAKGQIVLLNPERQNRYLHQDWDLTAAEVVATGFLDTDILLERPQPGELQRLRELMAQIEIAHLWDRPFLELSQGERRRTLIARSLATDPKVLLLDEFAEGLDRASQERLWASLESLADQGKAVVVTTHRHHPSLDREGWQTLDIEPSSHTTPQAGNHLPPERISPTGDAAPVLVRANGDLYLEGQLLVEGLDWTLHRGQHTAILGPNGCGKTSLLRLLWGELHLALGGHVTHFEDPELIVSQVRRKVGYFHPDMHAWFRPEHDARDVILSGLFSTIDLFDPVTPMDEKAMQAIAAEFETAHLLDRPFGSLSYGQGRRVLLARALVAQPQLALLDEPFDGLDTEARQQVSSLLEKRAHTEATTFVMTSHHDSDRPTWLREQLSFEADRSLRRHKIDSTA